MPRRALISSSLAVALAAPAAIAAEPANRVPARGATYVSSDWQLPVLDVPAEPEATETLVEALGAAYRSAPTLQIQRYELRATDEDYAQALSELRPTSQVQIAGNYSRTVPGRITQANRSPIDRLKSDDIVANDLSAELDVDQPLYTGGKAAADIEAGMSGIVAAREVLRAAEGDLFLRVITAYADVRRDSRILALRRASVRQLERTFYEVSARKVAGELTRTDIAQASTQVDGAIALANIAEQQLEQDRTAYAALIGHEPGTLAPAPELPQLPHSRDAALDLAMRLNPDLAQAIADERTSRARIASAAAEGRPKVSLRGTVRVGGQASPFHWYNEDQEFAGQAVISIPLTAGGRIGSLTEQARDRNAADRIRIEGARRGMVQSVIDAWNGAATAQRNLTVQQAQLASARVLDEGTFEEYRAGLRSTFDVLYAHGSLRDAEIAIETTRRDLYVAEASLLRHLGLLEARTILSGMPLYEPDHNTLAASRRGALPWDPAIRVLDGLAKPRPQQRGLQQPPSPQRAPELLPANPMPPAPMMRKGSEIPLPGTIGSPTRQESLRRP